MIGVAKGITADMARMKPDKQSGYEIHGVGNPFINHVPFIKHVCIRHVVPVCYPEITAQVRPFGEAVQHQARSSASL
jgi:hypothetical protein